MNGMFRYSALETDNFAEQLIFEFERAHTITNEMLASHHLKTGHRTTGTVVDTTETRTLNLEPRKLDPKCLRSMHDDQSPSVVISSSNSSVSGARASTSRWWYDPQSFGSILLESLLRSILIIPSSTRSPSWLSWTHQTAGAKRPPTALN